MSARSIMQALIPAVEQAAANIAAELQATPHDASVQSARRIILNVQVAIHDWRDANGNPA